MNKSFILIICIFLYPAIALCQLRTDVVYYLRSNGGLCSTSMIFYKDGTYFHEHGCEGSSYISLGKWTVRKDTVDCLPFSNKTYKFIDTIIATKVSADSVYVTVLDKNDSNITGIMTMGIFVPHVGLYPFKSNGTNTVKVAYNRPGGTLYLKKLSRVLRRNFEFETATANNFIIKLNISAVLFRYDAAEWDNALLFKLVIKGGKLIDPSSSPDFPVIFEVSE